MEKMRYFLILFSVLFCVACNDREVNSATKEVYEEKGKKFTLPNQKLKCDDISDNARLYVGGQEFLVPRQMISYLQQRDEQGYMRHVSRFGISCITSTDPPINLSSFSFLMPSEEYFKNARNTKTHFGYTTVSRVEVQEAHENEYDSYEQALHDQILTGHANYEHLLTDNGYYILRYKQKPIRYLLIPVDESFKTPSGNTVIFYCEHYAGGKQNPLRCDTKIKWGESLTLSITHIQENHILKS